MATRRRSNGDALATITATQVALSTLASNQDTMKTDIGYIREKIEFLYRIDPPGPLMQLSTHLSNHKAAKWRERTIFTMLAGAAGTLASYLWALIFKK